MPSTMRTGGNQERREDGKQSKGNHTMKPDEQAPRATVDAILEARKAAVTAAEDAKVCRKMAHEMEQTIARNTDAYLASLRRYHANLDRVSHMVEVTQVSSAVVLVLSIMILFFAMLKLVA